MLEIRHVTKVYKTKGGEQVRALDDVSITFGETGMVFLLGKSGSGKSTLLNVCGGLDAPDSGEIIVKGRSSKDFSGSDFDSYRNTYVGFIFQEYNILDEFSVEENIALALELQGKPKDKAAIASLLEDVDLKSYAKRKPNTLSGGQKQRVAIARALVKNPQIIMADEPTGALDSNTGKQVLDTLKKLSEKKLVIVVSHDREFAEKYGDRIIELKDGKVIRDVTKQELAPSEKTENLSVIQNNTVLVRRGSKLTDAELKRIRDIIVASDQDVLISADAEEIKTYKTAAKISADNAKECFSDIGEQPAARAYTSEESKFIRSRLPMRHAAKIGVSGIRLKPVRFAFTVLLSVIAFVMFGLFSCLMFYNGDTMARESLIDGNVQQLQVLKQYSYNDHVFYQDGEENVYTSWDNTAIRQQEVQDLLACFGEEAKVAYNLDGFEFRNIRATASNYYKTEVKYVLMADNLEYVEGTAPQSVDEIALSQYMYEAIKNGKVYDTENTNSEIAVNSYRDLRLEVVMSRTGETKTVMVSGIYRNSAIPDKYQALKDGKAEANVSYAWDQFLSNEDVATVAIAHTAYDTFAQYIGPHRDLRYSSLGVSGVPVAFTVAQGPDWLMGENAYQGYADCMIEYQGEGKAYDPQGNPIAAGELTDGVLVNAEMFANLYEMFVSQQMQDYGSMPPELIDEWNKVAFTDENGNEICYYNLAYYMRRAVGENNHTLFMRCWTTLRDFLSRHGLDTEVPAVSIQIQESMNQQIIVPTVTVRGFVFQTDSQRSNLYCDAAMAEIYKQASIQAGSYRYTETQYKPVEDGNPTYVCAWLPTQADGARITEILEFGKQTDGITRYSMRNELLNSVQMYNTLVGTLSQIFLYVGIAMAAFSMLLLFNFIAASISAKRREIGILRAVGAKGSDVFKIFLSEAAVIVLICIIAAIVLTGVISGYINDTIAKEMGMPFPLFTFGGASIGMIIGVAVGSALIATFLPVWRNARKKPVESIRSL